MRRYWPLLMLALPGCTFFTSSGGNPVPRSAAELKDVSPALYIVLAVFSLIMVASVLAILFKDEKSVPHHGDPTKMFAFFIACFAGLVVLLLVG